MLTNPPPVRDFNPMRPPDRDDPDDFYRSARREHPVFFSSGLQAWMVTRYDDVLTVLHDPTSYSSANAVPSVWDNPPAVTALLAGCSRGGSAVVDADAPSHESLRSLLDVAFSGARVRAALPFMRQRAHTLVDAFVADGAADLVPHYADPYVRSIISEVLGITRDEVDQVQQWSNDYLLLQNPLASVDAKVRATRSVHDYETYINQLIAARRRHPRDDFLSVAVHGHRDLPPMTEADIQASFKGLRIAGHDTTRDTITSTTLLLLQHPRHWAAATSDSRVLGRLIEETLRRDAPHRGLRRITTRQVILGDVTLPADAAVLLLFGAANRDDNHFADPAAVRPERANLKDHLAFGGGMHVCPGNSLARAEVRVALEALTTRLPTLRLPDRWRPRYTASYFFRGLETLPVRWEPRG